MTEIGEKTYEMLWDCEYCGTKKLLGKSHRPLLYAGVVVAVVLGQDEAIDLMLVALLSDGHVLLEGVPGTAKTLLARSFAATLDLSFTRIQFTPDLMPGDVLGTNLFNFQTSSFSLTKGPIFTDILLADEINRTPPKTQAALLEAMQERAVTIDGKSFQLGSDFMVVATQNPIEQQGTYPLPEAQLDRFLFKIEVTGGADLPEAVLAGLRAARHLGASSLEVRLDSLDGLEAMKQKTDIVVVDMHAEATSAAATTRAARRPRAATRTWTPSWRGRSNWAATPPGPSISHWKADGSRHVRCRFAFLWSWQTSRTTRSARRCRRSSAFSASTCCRRRRWRRCGGRRRARRFATIFTSGRCSWISFSSGGVRRWEYPDKPMKTSRPSARLFVTYLPEARTVPHCSFAIILRFSSVNRPTSLWEKWVKNDPLFELS